MLTKKINVNLLTIFVICILTAVNSFAVNTKKDKELTPKKWLEQIRNKYAEMESVDLVMQYQLYKGHKNSELHSSYNAYYKRDKNQFYQRIDNYEVIVNDECAITIHHDNGLMIISNPTKIDLFDANLETSLKQCQNVVISKSGKLITLNMFIHNKSSLPFSRIDIVANKNSELEKIVLYYAHETNFSDSYFNPEYDKARLEIHYLSTKTDWKDQKNILKTESYFSIKNSKIINAELFKNYQIIDYRKASVVE